MKTTIEISDHLLERAKRMAHEKKTTLRQLTEEGLSRVLDENERRKRVKLAPVTFKGKGLSPEFKGLGWGQIRDAAYKGRGS